MRYLPEYHFQPVTFCNHFTSFLNKSVFKYFPIITCTLMRWLISQYTANIYNRKEPFLFFLIPNCTDFFAVKNCVFSMSVIITIYLDRIRKGQMAAHTALNRYIFYLRQIQ